MIARQASETVNLTLWRDHIVAVGHQCEFGVLRCPRNIWVPLPHLFHAWPKRRHLKIRPRTNKALQILSET